MRMKSSFSGIRHSPVSTRIETATAITIPTTSALALAISTISQRRLRPDFGAGCARRFNSGTPRFYSVTE